MMGEPRLFSHEIADDEAGRRLDQVLASFDLFASRSLVQRLIALGCVTVDGRPADKKQVVHPGEMVEVEMPAPSETPLVPEEIPLDIRLEDAYLIVLCKQAGLVVHPSVGHASGTLVNALLAHTRDLGGLAGGERPGIVHRLDKDTSGLMVVAKDDRTQAALGDMIKTRAMERRYITLVHGRIAPDTGLIDAPVGRHPKRRERMAVVETPAARQAVTTFRTLERFDAGMHDEGYTLLECKLHTGRTHQVRVHMAYIKHAVVGDQLYGRRHPRADLGLPRQFLHAYRLTFAHPVTGETVDVRAGMPSDLRGVLAGLEDRSAGRTQAAEEVFGMLSEAGPCGEKG